MIIWLTGNTRAGKTKLANDISSWYRVVVLDGDSLRNVWGDSLGFSTEDRETHNLRVARLAKSISDQGFDVVVSVICPTHDLRTKVKAITDCTMVYVEGGAGNSVITPYEIPISPDFTISREFYEDDVNNLTAFMLYGSDTRGRVSA